MFAELMPTPGFLFVGASESLLHGDRIDSCSRITSGRSSMQNVERQELMANTSVTRVLIVDDSAYVRKVVTQMLSRSPFIEVVGTARDGRRRSSRWSR